MNAYQDIFATLDLEVTQDLNLGATIGLPPDAHQNTLRSSLPLLSLGDHDDSHFRISRLLGRGGMGVVHLARQPGLARDVAIKTVVAGASRESENALLQEARAMGVVEHPNVVPVHLIGQDAQGMPVIVMKRIDGTTWDHYIENHSAPGNDPIGFHLNTLSAVCQAIAFAHDKGILHRDIKPENIMIGRFGEVYLLDWGLAVSLDGAVGNIPVSKHAHSVVGTPVYMAPEMTVGKGELLGKHTDIFLLGATLFHAITGQPPNQGRTLFEVMSFAYTGQNRHYPEDVPEELRAILETSMALRPEDRFASAEALRQALQDFLTHRNSHELVHQARMRLDQLKGATPQERQTVFAETRFGFMSALQIWAENRAAKEGLQETLQTMIRQELSDQNTVAARQLLGQLLWPDDELSKAVLEVEKSLEKQQVKLAKIAYDYDENVGMRSRRLFIMGMAITFSILPFLFHSFEGWVVPGPLNSLTTDPILLMANAVGILFTPIIGLMLYYVFTRLKNHKTSRIFALGFFQMYILGFAARTSSLWHSTPLHLSIAAETMIYAAGLIMLGLAVDRRAGASGFFYAATALTLVLVPEYPLFIYSLGSVLACLGFLFRDRFRTRSIVPWLNQDNQA